MNLRDFVKDALLEIDSALEDVSKESKIYDYKYGGNSTSGNNVIDFNIQVYSGEEDKKSGGGGIKVAGLVALGVDGSSNTNSYNLSEINFSITREKKEKRKMKPYIPK